MTKEIQESCKILIGIDYPKPIVNHANARQEAILLVKLKNSLFILNNFFKLLILFTITVF